MAKSIRSHADGLAQNWGRSSHAHRTDHHRRALSSTWHLIGAAPGRVRRLRGFSTGFSGCADEVAKGTRYERGLDHRPAEADHASRDHADGGEGIGLDLLDRLATQPPSRFRPAAFPIVREW